MQACIVEHHIMQHCNCTKCAHQTFPATFGALDIKMMDGRRMENCNGDSDFLGTIMYRVD